MTKSSRDFNKATLFLLFCSGISIKLIKKCPQFEVNKYNSIGLTIVFTTLLSSLSAYFAFSLIFDSLIFVLFASMIWGGMIFNLDRYIVSTLKSISSRKSEIFKAIPRLIIAILIALVISKPIEIQLFKKEINTFLEKEKISSLDAVKEKYTQPIKTIDKRKDDLNSKLENKIAVREIYYSDYKCECEGTCGTGKRGRGTECESRQEKYETFAAEVEIEKKKTDFLLKELNLERKQLIEKQEAESQIVSEEFEPGFFDRIRALNEIAPIASTFILLIFIMVEISPILTKLLSTKGPYELLVEESELSYEMQLQKIKDNYDDERDKKKKLRKVNFDIELENKEFELKKNLKSEAYARYKKMQEEINKNL